MNKLFQSVVKLPECLKTSIIYFSQCPWKNTDVTILFVVLIIKFSDVCAVQNISAPNALTCNVVILKKPIAETSIRNDGLLCDYLYLLCDTIGLKFYHVITLHIYIYIYIYKYIYIYIHIYLYIWYIYLYIYIYIYIIYIYTYIDMYVDR